MVKKLTKVSICGMDFKIEYVKGLEDLGRCHVSECLIKVNAEQPEPMMLDTLVHEILHGIMANSGARQFIDANAKLYDRTEFEETLIRILTPHIVASLKEVFK